MSGRHKQFTGLDSKYFVDPIYSDRTGPDCKVCKDKGVVPSRSGTLGDIVVTCPEKGCSAASDRLFAISFRGFYSH